MRDAVNSSFRIVVTAAAMLPAAATLSDALAQVTPSYNIGDALREAAPPKPPVNKPEAVPVLPQIEDETLSLPEGKTLFVRDFRLEGVEFVDEAELQAALAPFKERELSLAEIFEAANRITLLYRERGFLVAKAHVPKQDARSGTLTIKVVVGRYGRFRVENSSPLHDFLVEGAFETAAAPSRVVTKDSLERAMLLVSDMPGVRMPKLAIAPGEAPGTSDFVVSTEAADRFNGYVLANNYGSRYTGRNRLSAGLDVNAPLGLADKLSLAVMGSEGAGIQNGRAAYSFPLHHSGLRAELAAARTTYKLGDVYRDLEATGVANSWEGTLSYPLVRSSEETITVSLNGAAKRLRDKSFGLTINPKDSQVATLGLNRQSYGSLLGFRTSSTLQSAFSLGNLEFENVADELANRAGADTAGSFSKLTVGAQGGMMFSDDWSLSASARGQKAMRGKNLDGSEQMSISGINGVKAYPEGVSGDNGYLLDAELKYALPQFGDYRHSLGLFVETGRVYIQDNDYTGEGTGTRLNDIGIGYYANLEYADGRYLIATLQATHILGPQQETGEKTGKAKVLAQIGLTF